MGRLFGTDGIRGRANTDPMTAEMVMRVGRAVAAVLGKNGAKGDILIGKDTRISGDMLECALVSGICSMGWDARLAGILPTPAVACVAARTGAGAGIVLSASHNPFHDNGIKIFDRHGYKLSEETEAEIERLTLDQDAFCLSSSKPMPGRISRAADAGKEYVSFLQSLVPGSRPYANLKIVADCSNGATFRVAPEVLSGIVGEIGWIGIDPDGININEGCGSQKPEELARKVVETRADVGFAFDGDGDRVIAVDEKGKIVTGDQILAICARMMKRKGVLKNNRIVSTVMSNVGLGIALKEMGILLETCDVGDRNVMKKMVSSGSVLGGEDSGHVIFLDHHTTGDGILTALKLLEAMEEASMPLSELSRVMTAYPQVLKNIEIARKPAIEHVPEIVEAVRAAEHALQGKGRILVRYSGTEPLCRVMVEGETAEEAERWCDRICDVVREALGDPGVNPSGFYGAASPRRGIKG